MLLSIGGLEIFCGSHAGCEKPQWQISMISFDYDPFVSLLLRSMLITIAFAVLSYLLKLTGDVQKFINKVLPTIKKS